MTSSPGYKNGSDTPTVVMMNMSTSTQPRQADSTSMHMAQAHTATSRFHGSQKSKSSPSTPFHRSQPNGGQHTSPPTSQSTREGSPRSLTSESSQTPTAPRRPHGGCKFETGMAKARRRVPYSLGTETLEAEPEEQKKKLGQIEEAKLTSEIQELYAQLVPNTESESRRTKFVQKLESILQARWPGQQINVSVFGSTGNCLGTSDSDVDICITTDCKEIEHVCSIADLLDKNGMERVVCVSSAKVPIVKVWDPELQVACDMNVNNPIALENTHMIRSYTAIDHRFRPLAMVIKHWAKKRMLNDAALGGTLSSYTWICMVLNFLQTRCPPILPTLQQEPNLAPNVLNGVNVAFDKALEKYTDFGGQNESTLGQLLFQFFRYYGHELDYEQNAVSVRLGKTIPKSQITWHPSQNTRLGVEEPFNTSRNLANTADDTSVRGIHLELRRAFKLVADGKWGICCEQYEAAPEERKNTETFIPPTSRPIIPQAPTQPAAQTYRSSRNGSRGGRHGGRNSGRRASNPAGRNSTYLHDLPFQMTPQELQLQAQHQQHLLHDQLYQQYQYLQLQEQELRMQLYQQSMRQRGLGPSQSSSQNALNNGSHSDSGSTITTNTPLRMGMSPTMFQNRYSATSPFLRNATPASGVMTNPASPLLANIGLDGRRYTRRTSVTNSSPAGSLRAHSQPARVMGFNGPFAQVRPTNEAGIDRPEGAADRRTSYSNHPHMYAPGYGSQPVSVASSIYEAGRRPVEYMGYYIGQSPSLSANTQNSTISPIPLHAGLAIHNGGLSPKLSSRSSQLASVASSPSMRSTNLEDASELAASSDVANGYHTASEQPDSPKARTGPLIVDGSIHSPQRRRLTIRPSLGKNEFGTLSASTSDDLGIDTPSSSDDQYQEYRRTSLAKRRNQHGGSQHGAVQSNGLSDQHSNHPSAHKSAVNGVVKEDGLPSIDEVKDTSEVPSTTDSVTLVHADTVSSPKKSDGSINGLVIRKKGKTERASPTIVESLPEMSTPLALKTNGQENGVTTPPTVKHTDASSGWQTQKKKKRSRKTVKSENDAALVNRAGGELFPLDEALRKGG